MTNPQAAAPAPGLVLDQHAQDVLFREARTANTFTDEPVSDEQIQAAYDLVKWAPTSFNQQPLRMLLVRSQPARERLAALMWDNNRAKTERAPLTAILAADIDFHEHLPTLFPLLPGIKDMFFSEEAVRTEEATRNGTLQVAYFILGLRAAGLAVGPMSGFDVDGVSKEFFPDGRHRALVVMNIGKPGPNAWPERLPRLAYPEVVSVV